jgi:hypothetical protein
MKDRMKLSLTKFGTKKGLAKEGGPVGIFVLTDCSYDLRASDLTYFGESVGGAVSEVEGYGVESRIRVV